MCLISGPPGCGKTTWALQKLQSHRGACAYLRLAGDSPEKRQQREQEVPLQRVGSPEDMAATVSFLVGPDSAYITGAILHVNGGLYLP